MIKKLLYTIALISCSYTYAQSTYEIEEPEDIKNFILEAGDTVILRNGVYDSDERIKFLGNGTEDQPITFRPETPGGVVFTGGLKISIAGSYLVVDGFYWNGGFGASNFIQFRDGTTYAENCTIQNCAINNLGVDPDDIEVGTSIKHRWIVLYGNYNNVLNCSFMNKSTSGALVLVELEFNASPDGEDGTLITRCEEVGHTISNNYFYKYDKIDTSLTNAGDSETIRVGESTFQNVNSATTVSNNYFVEADGENEIISNKSANNFFTNNTFRRCRGSLVLRHGSGATIDRNYFLGENVEGTGGVRISDSDHTITNNYIQDCITTVDQAIWNNGITFMGGNTNSVDDCNATNTNNGYQDAEDINVSNNTFINTNAPLFYNINKGKTINTGAVQNNLIYFDEDSANASLIISGDAADSYTDIGQTLTYDGNVFTGELGVTNAGFSSTDISLTEDGEVFTHDQSSKGADMGGFIPHTDVMVGNGIGACFLDFQGNSISSPICTISEIDAINIGSLSNFSAETGSMSVSVNANVAWTATEDIDWVSITPTSGDGTGDESVVITVTENTDSIDRTGVVTFSQTGGGITRNLNVNQSAQDPRSKYVLINDESANDNVDIEFVFHEEITETKNNIAINTLDKNFDTQWSGMNVNDVPGEIIFDLGGIFDLALVDFAATRDKTYEFQIWVSTTGTEASDFVNAFPDEGNADGNLTSNTTGEFKSFELSSPAEGVRYVKIFGYGQPARPSPWNTITEIEFYRSSFALSVGENIIEDTGIALYPNPITQGIFNMKATSSEIDYLKIYNALGALIKEERFDATNLLENIDVSALNPGLYFVEIGNEIQGIMKKVIISE